MITTQVKRSMSTAQGLNENATPELVVDSLMFNFHQK